MFVSPYSIVASSTGSAISFFSKSQFNELGKNTDNTDTYDKSISDRGQDGWGVVDSIEIFKNLNIISIVHEGEENDKIVRFMLPLKTKYQMISNIERQNYFKTIFRDVYRRRAKCYVVVFIYGKNNTI